MGMGLEIIGGFVESQKCPVSVGSTMIVIMWQSWVEGYLQVLRKSHPCGSRGEFGTDAIARIRFTTGKCRDIKMCADPNGFAGYLICIDSAILSGASVWA